MGKWDEVAAAHDRERSQQDADLAFARSQISGPLQELNEHMAEQGKQIASLLTSRRVKRVEVGKSRLIPAKGWRLRVVPPAGDSYGTSWELDARGRWVSILGDALPLKAYDEHITGFWAGRNPRQGSLLMVVGLGDLYFDDHLRPVVGSVIRPEPLDKALESAVRALL